VEGGTNVSFDVGPVRSPLLFKSIDDFHGKLHNGRGIFPPSDTVQHSFDCNALRPLQPWIQNEGVGNASVTPLRDSYPPIYDSVVFNFPIVSDDSWYDFGADACLSFATQIPTEVSLANFSWELRELGQLLPKLENSIQSTISGGFLNFQFGWKPFLSDLQKLSGILSTVQGKINHLKQTYGKKTKLGMYRGDVLKPTFSDYTSIVTDARLNSVSYRWQLAEYRADLRAGGYLFHKLKDLDSLYGYIRALFVALGLDNPLRAVWQALPYSFVVDWVFGLSHRLGSLSINPFKGDWQVSDFSSSCFTVAKWKVIQVIANPYVEIPLGSVIAKRYVRISQLPVRSTFLTLNVPSPQQLLLTNAMLAQH